MTDRIMKRAVETFGAIQLWITIAALTLAPLLFGSVDQLSVAIWAVALSIATLVGPTKPMGLTQKRVLSAFLALCGAYVLVAIVQIVPHVIDRLDDPVWQRAGDLLGVHLSPRISNRAEIPPDAIGHFLLLVTSLLSGFFVGASRRESEVLVATARYAILVYAVYGIAALALTPNLILWAPKLAYRGSLTATFVNHNTAATMVGAGAILWFCLTCLSLQSLRSFSIRLLLLVPSNERIVFKIILRAVAGLVCFFALLFTRSRGGLICTSAGLLVAIGLMVANKVKPRLWYILASGGAALVVIAAWLTRTGGIGSKGLFDHGRWSVYGSCIEAIGQHPILGTGLGTFADIFPSLRSADVSRWGVWDYAHSTVLEIAVEMGIPIAAMVVLAATASLVMLARAALDAKGYSRGSLSAIAGVGVLSYLHSMIDFSLQIPGYLIMFGILLGCGLARAAAEQMESDEVRQREVAAAT